MRDIIEVTAKSVENLVKRYYTKDRLNDNLFPYEKIVERQKKYLNRYRECYISSKDSIMGKTLRYRGAI